MSIKKPVPVDDNGRTIQGWDPTNHAPAVPAILNTQFDGEILYGNKGITLLDANGNPITSGHPLYVSVVNGNNNGPNTMANSAPVTIASNQTPVAVQQQLIYASLLGECFSATTGKFAASGTPNAAISIFNNSTAKTVVIYSILVFDSTGQSFVDLYRTTVNPALGTAITPVNAKPGGGASAIASTCTWATGSVATTGDTLDRSSSTPSNLQMMDLLLNSAPIILPPNAANGILVVDSVGSVHNLAFNVFYFEY